ncbi:glycosyltransferase family 4 protein [Candidatus Fermentibacteria bacterium]|nr:glycosyltransferase family 4 protein [Candidatus Fermentibacteria bacterium]
MRVLLLSTSFRLEGPANTFIHIARYSRSAGIDLMAGALAGRGPAEAIYRKLGVPTVYFGRPGVAGMGIASRLRRFLSSEGVDVVCCQLLRGEVVGALATRDLSTCRVVCVVQNEDPYRILTKNPPKALLSRWALGRAARVVAVSRSLADFITQHQRVPPESVTVVPNAVDPAKFPTRAAASRPQDLPAGGPLLGCVGRLAPQKGQRILISAFHRLVRSLPDASLLLVGDGPNRQALARLADRGAGASRIHLTGWKRSVGPYLPFLDVYVQPSMWEGMPFATLEAMASGVAVVASSVGGLSEILGNECGVLVPPGNDVALADAILKLLCDDEARTAMARSGRRRVHSHYRADQMATAYFRLFGQVASEAPRSS